MCSFAATICLNIRDFSGNPPGHVAGGPEISSSHALQSIQHLHVQGAPLRAPTDSASGGRFRTSWGKGRDRALQTGCVLALAVRDIGNPPLRSLQFMETWPSTSKLIFLTLGEGGDNRISRTGEETHLDRSADRQRSCVRSRTPAGAGPRIKTTGTIFTLHGVPQCALQRPQWRGQRYRHTAGPRPGGHGK